MSQAFSVVVHLSIIPNYLTLLHPNLPECSWLIGEDPCTAPGRPVSETEIRKTLWPLVGV